MDPYQRRECAAGLELCSAVLGGRGGGAEQSFRSEDCGERVYLGVGRVWRVLFGGV